MRLRWPFKKQAPVEQEQQQDAAPSRAGFWTTDMGPRVPHRLPTVPDFRLPAQVPGFAMDSVIGQPNSPKQGLRPGIPESLMEWYATQGFIGYSACALIAQHWLVDKVCGMPGRDAIRQGYSLNTGDDDLSEKLRATDRRYRVDPAMCDLIRFGRVYGVRAVLFDVLSTDPEYYEKPFNIDGVVRGCYMGLRAIDPQWMTPELTGGNVIDPAAPEFMDPTFWRIGARRIHRTHLHFFVPHPVPDLLKPSYNYGGVPVPQRVYERVYAAERTANEAPQLAMTKRLNTFQAAEGADMDRVLENMNRFAEVRNNYGVLVHGQGESVGQFDTTLGDFDALLMTQYQLVAAAANIPATKLMGTTPKGFNATGESEEAAYREELESIQTNDLTPLLDRHYRIVARHLGLDLSEGVTVQWQPLDSPTAAEFANIQKVKAETDKLYFDMGAIDNLDVRQRIREDKEGDYFNLAESDDELNPDGLIDAEAETDPAQTPLG